MIDISKIKAHSARIKAIIAGHPYEAPVAHVEPEVPVEPIVVPEIPEVQPEPEIVHVEPEVQPEPEVQVEHVEEYPLNQD
jgi:hypothetical protein